MVDKYGRFGGDRCLHLQGKKRTGSITHFSETFVFFYQKNIKEKIEKGYFYTALKTSKGTSVELKEIRETMTLCGSTCIYIYIYMCVCVCVLILVATSEKQRVT
jgi:hypothetical protein